MAVAVGRLFMERLTRIFYLTIALTFAVFIILPCQVSADMEYAVLFWYGCEADGHLGRPTAFASWYEPPSIPLVVRADWPGIALHGYAPGTRVRITVVGLPEWTTSWPELSGIVGNSVTAYVADRPGGEYGDAWPATFLALTNGRLWIGKLYVEIEVIE